MKSPRMLATAAIAGLAMGQATTGQAATPVKPYARPVGSAYQVKPLLSAGDRVPETSRPARTYQMVGIPDGLGLHRDPDGSGTLFVNHELRSAVTSEPVVGGATNVGAFVSKFRLSPTGEVISGERAYDRVYVEDRLIGPAAQLNNFTPAFSRFCSATLAGAAEGFDRPIYLTNEENDATDTFDRKGGVTVAVYDNQAHVLPGLGHFSKENTIVKQGTGNRTVIMSMEDGPETPDSQLWMYVGTKVPRATSVLARNGLLNGKLYVFVSTTPGRTDEASFANGTISGRWAEVPNAGRLTSGELEDAADAAGAFGFVRIEDGDFAKRPQGGFYFATTGENPEAGNGLGRLYHLRLNGTDVTGPAALEVIVNADEVVAARGDTAISPDNVSADGRYLMVQEDGTDVSRPVMAAKGREGSIWRYDLDRRANRADFVASARRVVSLDPPGRDGVPVVDEENGFTKGIWETSGIISGSPMFGANSWLFDVQAHSPTTAPADGTVEDGQLLLMTPKPA